jgi:S-(hydroxymethyl)glutathione dehydrogenase/alcohol dehydrogenase
LRFPDGRPVHQFLGVSSFAELMLVHEHAAVRIDPAMRLDVAALLGCGLTTGLGAVTNTARVPFGATVAVVGCGGIGLGAVQGANLSGASLVIAVDVTTEKLELAHRVGATHTINARDTDPVAAVRELTDGLGVEFAFEAIGQKVTAEQAIAMIGRSGTCVVVGMLPPGETVEIAGSDLLLDKRILGCRMGSNRFRIDIPRYVDLYLQDRLRIDDLVSETLSFEEIDRGFESMRLGRGARSVVVMVGVE